MSIIASTGFEAGSVGAAVPDDGTDFYNAGSASGTATVVYAGDHPVAGSMGIRFACGTGSGSVTRTRTFTAAAVGSYRPYLWVDAAPAANVAIASLYSGATKVADLRLTSGGGIQVRDVSTAVGTTLTMPTGQHVRVEWKVDPGGTQALQLHYGVNLHSATASASTSGSATGSGATTVDELRTGIGSFVSGYGYWADEVAVGNADFCGPISTSVGVDIAWPAAEIVMGAPDLEVGHGDTVAWPSARTELVGTLWDVSANTGTGTRVDIAWPSARMDLVWVPPSWVGPVSEANGYLVEVELDGTWTDITAAVDGDAGVKITYGRSSRWDDTGPGECKVVVDNRTGAFTPDNPASPYWPHLAEGCGLRVAALQDGASWPLFAGTVDGIELDATSGTMAASTVTLAASDALARLGRMKARPLPEQRALSWPGLATYLPLDDPEGGTGARNLGKGGLAQGFTGPATSPAAWIEQSTDGYPGAWKLGVDPEGLTFDGSLEITRHASHLSGPVLRVRVAEVRSLVVGAVEFCARSTDPVPAGATEIVWWSCLDGHGVCLTVGYDAAGRLRVVSPARYVYAEQVWTTPVASRLDDGQWHHIRLELVGATTEVSVDGVPALVAPTWLWAEGVDHCLGGRAAWHAPGRATSVGSAAFAGYCVTMQNAAWTDPQSLYADGLLVTAVRADTRVETLLASAGADSRLVYDDPSVVGGAKTGGESVLATLQRLQRTTGAILAATPTSEGSRVDWVGADFVRGHVPAAILDAETDLAGGGPVWVRDADDRPTRVTASSPAAGSVTVVDPDRESEVTFHVEATLDTAAATSTRLHELAGGRLAASVPRRRIAAVTVELTHTVTAGLWDVLCRPTLGDRVRVANLPTAYLGQSYEDGHIEGVTIQVTETGHRVTLDLAPADNPPEGVFDHDEYGRFAGDGLSLGTGVDADDTTLSMEVTAGLPALSTDSDDYPLDLVVGEERVTVLSAPSAPSGGGIDGARAKLADVATAAFNIVVIGDSIGEGMAASAVGNRWVDRLQARLRTDYPVAGVPTVAATYVPAWYGMAETGWLAWPSPTRVGATTQADYGLGGRSVRLDAVGESITFTGTGSQVELFYLRSDFFAAEFDVTIDGGTPVTLDAFDAGAAGGVATSWTVGGLGSGSHTVIVSHNNSRPGNSSFILGCRFPAGDGARTVHVWDASQGGYTADLHDGLNLTQLAVVAPDLAVIALGFNDAGGTYTPSQFDAKLDSLIAAVRAQVTGCPVLLVGYYNPRDAEAGWVTPDWSQYVNAMGTVAGSTSYCELLDLTALMPDTWADTEGLYGDLIHPSDLGHEAIAGHVADFIELGAHQTVTVTRGVAPTVATAHPAGTAVDVWHAATYAI